MTPTLIIVLVTTMAAVMVSVVVFFSLSARRSAEAARKEHPDARHIEGGALFFGLESRGGTQARGNGTLIFGAAEIIFKQWVVNREFRVPYRNIQSLEMPRSFLGKTQAVKLLQVNFLDENGNADAIAWRVNDLDGAMRRIEDARQVSS